MGDRRRIASSAEGLIVLLLFLPEGTVADLRFIMACHSLCSSHYPGRFAKSLVFPTSWVTGVIWAGLQQVLSTETLEMVILMPAESGRQPPELLDHIAEDQLL